MMHHGPCCMHALAAGRCSRRRGVEDRCPMVMMHAWRAVGRAGTKSFIFLHFCQMPRPGPLIPIPFVGYLCAVEGRAVLCAVRMRPRALWWARVIPHPACCSRPRAAFPMACTCVARLQASASGLQRNRYTATTYPGVHSCRALRPISAVACRACRSARALSGYVVDMRRPNPAQPCTTSCRAAWPYSTHKPYTRHACMLMSCSPCCQCREHS